MGVRYVWDKETRDLKKRLVVLPGSAIALLPDMGTVGVIVERTPRSRSGVTCDLTYPDGSTARAVVDVEYLVPRPA